jgi:hypothetical protein
MQRCFALLAGQELSVSDAPDVPSDQPVPASAAQTDPQLARVLRAKGLVEMKRLSRATKALLQGTLAPMSGSTIAALRALHPQASEPVPDLPEDAPRVQVVLSFFFRVDGRAIACFVG